MKVAIVYNRNSRKVINLFGLPNKENIGLRTIQRIADGLRKGGHQVRTIEGDKDLVPNLEDFMPRVVKGELPGLAFNISYGIQGQARYTHVPSILEMVGIPYVGSGPLAHSLALDKVVAKVIFRQQGITTPDFAVLDAPGFQMPDLSFPLIVKPKNEAVSFGIRIVQNEKELREGADIIFQQFNQPVLVEQYIEGREINVGLLGNNPPETFPPVELIFGPVGPPIYTLEDKKRTSGREVGWECPAQLDADLLEAAQDLARRAFSALGCLDCARVDMRLDKDGKLYVLEINSLPSLGEHGSYTIAAGQVGLDFSGLVCRLIEVASARYFGTPSPPQIGTRKKDLGQMVFSYLVERRDGIERRVREWTDLSSRTADPTGLHEAQKKLARFCDEMGLRPVDDLTDNRSTWTWQTKAGVDGGMLLVGHLDVPLELGAQVQMFRRDPEWLFGEGIGVSRAPLVCMQFALRALRSVRRLRHIPLGLLYYTDEGRDCRYSQEIIRAAASRADSVLVLRPGNLESKVINQRRGWRKYRLTVIGSPRRLGQVYKKRGVLRWISSQLDEVSRLTCRTDRIAVAASDLKTESFPRLLPHRATATILLSFLDAKKADDIEQQMRKIMDTKDYQWNLELISDRPPMKKSRRNEKLLKSLRRVAGDWEIPFDHESSLYPSAAGLAPDSTAVICGIGPIVQNMDTPQESILRISLMQRTLLLAQFLATQTRK
jgi:D-alanine-D-alanine ligase